MLPRRVLDGGLRSKRRPDHLQRPSDIAAMGRASPAPCAEVTSLPQGLSKAGTPFEIRATQRSRTSGYDRPSGRLTAQHPEGHANGPEQDCVAVGKLGDRCDRVIADERPVLAAQILQGGAAADDAETGVVAGHGRIGDARANTRLSADQMVALAERHAPARPLEAAGGEPFTRRCDLRFVVHLRGECIPVPVHGTE